jgi:hypothetical protein
MFHINKKLKVYFYTLRGNHPNWHSQVKTTLLIPTAHTGIPDRRQ